MKSCALSGVSDGSLIQGSQALALPYSRITRLHGGRRSVSPQPNAVPGSQVVYLSIHLADPTRVPGWTYKPILRVRVLGGDNPNGQQTIASKRW